MGDLQLISLKDIKPYSNNNKKHSERQIKLIANSIRDFGMNSPIILDLNNEIIAGHARLEACKLLKFKEIPCIKKTDLTPEQIKAYRIADNKLSDLGEYDLENIDAEIADLLEADFNLSEYGLDDLIPKIKEINENLEINDNHIIYVELETESEQQSLWEELEKRGYKCKII